MSGIGFFAVYFYIVEPVRGVLAYAPSIEFNGKFIILAPFMLGAGLLLTLFGGRVAEILERDTKSPLRWVAGGLAIAGLALVLWVRWFIESHGYSG